MTSINFFGAYQFTNTFCTVNNFSIGNSYNT